MGRPAKDLTGKQIGYWTVIKRIGSTITGRIQPTWLVKCVCGTEKILTSDSLKRNGSRSCGCKTKELSRKSHVKDLTGQRFGRLVVLYLDENSTNAAKWVVKCDCGIIKTVVGASLQKEKILSCGCYFKEITLKKRFKNEIGNIYSRLTVIERTYKNNKGEWYWRCVCTCGNETEVKGTHLRSGAVQSCGCLGREALLEANTTHGMSKTKEYNTSRARKRRELEKLYDSKYGDELERALEEFFSACIICGMTRKEHYKKYGKNLQNDHVIPLSKGHGLVPGNAVVLCRVHNQSKQARSLDKLPKEWANLLLEEAMHFNAYWNTVIKE